MSDASTIPRSHLWGLLWTLVRTDFKTRYHGTLFAHKVQVWNTYRDIIYELTS